VPLIERRGLVVVATTTRTEVSRVLSPIADSPQMVEVGEKNAGLIVSELPPLDPQKIAVRFRRSGIWPRRVVGDVQRRAGRSRSRMTCGSKMVPKIPKIERLLSRPEEVGRVRLDASGAGRVGGFHGAPVFYGVTTESGRMRGARGLRLGLLRGLRA